MLHFASPHDDDYYDSDEDSSISTAVSDRERADTHDLREEPRRTSSIDDCKRIAVERAKYFRRKYAVERVLGGVMFVAAAPVIAVLIGLVRITSRGPGIYRQKRVGLHGETFHVYKLRSMYVDAERGGKPVWSTKKDKRITPLGKVLRRTHLDELPQLWNVVKGEMSLTGPRPERPEICEVLTTFIDDYYHRNVVKPGVTGLAQINLEPDETVADVKRKQFLDLLYIQNADLWLDLRMLTATGLRVIGIRGGRAMKLLSLCRAPLVVERVIIQPGDNRKLFPDQGGRAANTTERSSSPDHRSDPAIRCDRRHAPK
ncbi:sugar transferase [Stieleria magnilauensis]|uniref:UDP-glucose:undecaprenyl-phosphate glucose-1-phosphate transferase n=1 Tax=Stieleria magnilauensis TaxID=2527963 RepID=A0ABX5XLZ2_9BACT|nr:UDP-glucose:undecaprenyl-phosphate glucose-1-phosphate transferase [Planctomycetes bacterium TBK1r]